MSKKHKKVSRVFIYIEHLLILVSTVRGCISIGIPIRITSSAIGLKLCGITAGIKKYKSIIKKKKKKHDKMVLLAKSKLNSMEVLISKVSINLNISHDEFVVINNMLKEFYDITEEI